MAKITTILFVLLVGFYTSAQEPNSTVHLSDSYYDVLKAKALSVLPIKEKLIKATAQPLPPDFEDTLLAYDWYEVADYFFKTKSYNSPWDDIEYREKTYASNQYNFIHYTEDKKEFSMYIHRYKDGRVIGYLGYFTDDLIQYFIGIEKENGKNYIKTKSERYPHPSTREILSYSNGLLITKSEGSPNSATRKFHHAYIAVKKVF